jgi:hypothetical protein
MTIMDASMTPFLRLLLEVVGGVIMVWDFVEETYNLLAHQLK